MFKIVTNKTFKKLEDRVKRDLESAEFLNKQAQILFKTAKSDLDEIINDYFLTSTNEQHLIVEKVGHKIHYVIFKRSIYSKTVVPDYNGPWKKDNNIPVDVFNYFYNGKKCE